MTTTTKPLSSPTDSVESTTDGPEISTEAIGLNLRLGELALDADPSRDGRESAANTAGGTDAAAATGPSAPGEPTLIVTALFDYAAQDDAALSFRRGETLQVLTRLPSGWWDGVAAGRRGWFPSTYVSKPKILPPGTPITPENIATALAQSQAPEQSPPDSSDSLSSPTASETTDPSIHQQQSSHQHRHHNLRISINSHYSGESSSTSPGAFVPSRRFSRIRTPSSHPSDLPPNWNFKTAPDGRVYYYNHVTNETYWTLQEAHDAHMRRIIKESSGAQPSPITPDGESPHGLSSIGYAKSAVTTTPGITSAVTAAAIAQQLDAEGPIEWTWPGLTNRIDSRIHLLTDIITRNRKAEFVSSASSVIDAVRTAFYASGMSKRDSEILSNNTALRLLHRQLHSLLSQLAIEAQSASGIWPPPDASVKLAQTASDLAIVANNFSATAEGHNVTIKPIPELAHSNAHNQHFKHPTQAIQNDNPAQQRPKSVAPSIASLTDTGSFVLINDHGQSGAGLIAFLERSMRKIFSISRDLTNPALLASIRRDNPTPTDGSGATCSSGDDPAASSVALIASVRSIVQEVGQFLESVDELPLDSLSEDLTVDFKVSRLALYNAISGLVASTQMVINVIPPVNATQDITTAAHLVEKSVRDLLISTKYLVEEKENWDQMELQTFIQQQQERQSGQESMAGQSPVDESTAVHPKQMFSMEYAQSQPAGFGVPPSVTSSVSAYDAITAAATTSNDAGDGAHRVDKLSQSSMQQRQPIQSGSTVYPKHQSHQYHHHIQLPLYTSDVAQSRCVDKNPSNASVPPLTSTSSSTASSCDFMTEKLAFPMTASPIMMPSLTSELSNMSLGTLPSLGKPSRRISDDEDGVCVARRNTKLKHLLGEDAPQTVRNKPDVAWYLRPDFSSDEIVLNAEGHIRGGTLKALVEKLTLHSAVDASFTLRFLLTYKSFTNSVDLFRLLEKRFTIQPPDGLAYTQIKEWTDLKLTPIRLRVFNVLKSWVEHYLGNDDSDRDALLLAREFAQTTMRAHMRAASNQLLTLISRRMEHGPGPLSNRIATTAGRDYPTPIFPKNIRQFRLLDIDPLELARQITILEGDVFCRIQPSEFLDRAWSSREKSNASINVKEIILLFNRIMRWTAASILGESDLRKRTKVMSHFISVAEKCSSLNNFSGLMAILGSLDSAHVHRLRKTWELIPAKQMATYETLRETMSASRNFSNYRTSLHSANPPCVPFLGCYLTDLTFIAEGNPDTIKNNPNMINFGKMAKTADVLRDIQQFQHIKYSLIKVPEIQDYLESVFVGSVNDEDLYEVSLRLEPRATESIGAITTPTSATTPALPVAISLAKLVTSPSMLPTPPPQPLSASTITSLSSSSITSALSLTSSSVSTVPSATPLPSPSLPSKGSNMLINAMTAPLMASGRVAPMMPSSHPSLNNDTTHASTEASSRKNSTDVHVSTTGMSFNIANIANSMFQGRPMSQLSGSRRSSTSTTTSNPMQHPHMQSTPRESNPTVYDRKSESGRGSISTPTDSKRGFGDMASGSSKHGAKKSAGLSSILASSGLL